VNREELSKKEGLSIPRKKRTSANARRKGILEHSGIKNLHSWKEKAQQEGRRKKSSNGGPGNRQTAVKSRGKR